MARLPVVGGDSGNWGSILNDFLEVSLNGDGTIQPGAVTQAGGLISGQAAGGDLSGSYPNATVARINGISITGTPSSGEALVASSATAAGWVTVSVGTTLLIAASNAQSSTKQRADYVCSGTGDDEVINAAIASLTNGGRVLLSEGSFYLQNPIASNLDTITIEGMGTDATVLLPQTVNTTLTALVELGSTTNISQNLLCRMYIYGRRDAGSITSGHGVLVQGSTTTLRDLHVDNVASDGVHMTSYDGSTRYENYMENVLLTAAGSNGLFLDSMISNNEFVRCYAVGGQVPASDTSMTLAPGAFGNYCFYNTGSQNKFVVCHAYFGQWGMYSTGNGIQIIGGEYETNQSGGISIENSMEGRVIGAAVYDNLGSGISLTNNAYGMQVRDNWIGPSNRSGMATYGILLTHAYRNVVAGNVIAEVASGEYGIYLNSDSNRNEILGNQLSPMGLSPSGTGGNAIIFYDSAAYNHVHGNLVEGLIEENFGGDGSPSYDLIEDNTITFGGAYINCSGNETKVRRNNGYVTEASGTATITGNGSTGTNVQIVHGLKGLSSSQTPAVITVTPSNSLGAASKFWVSGASNTVFNIYLNVDPGNGVEATFYWEARTLP
jgi:hypothetical protein